MSFLLSLPTPAIRSAVEEWAGIELYHAELMKYLSLGGLVALAALCLAVFGVATDRRRGVWVASQIGAVLAAGLALWAALVVGVHMGYGKWQAFPGAGDQAYADGAKLMGAILFGWMPSGFLAVVGWCSLTVAKKVSGRLPRSSTGSPRVGK